MSYTYDYPRPAVTVDMIVWRRAGEGLQILLIERGHNPFKGTYALPGGFVDLNENLADAAYRELLEETGINNLLLKQFYTFGDKGRDPRGHTVSVVFAGCLLQQAEATAGDDAASLAWFPIDKLPPLAFDHKAIIDKFLAEYF